MVMRTEYGPVEDATVERIWYPRLLLMSWVSRFELVGNLDPRCSLPDPRCSRMFSFAMKISTWLVG